MKGKEGAFSEIHPIHHSPIDVIGSGLLMKMRDRMSRAMAHVKIQRRSPNSNIIPYGFVVLFVNHMLCRAAAVAAPPLVCVDSNTAAACMPLCSTCAPRHCLPQQHQDHLKPVLQHNMMLLSLCNPYLALQRSRCDAPYSPRPAAQHAAPPRQPSKLSHAPSLSPPLPFAFSLAATGDLFQHFFIGTWAHFFGAA